MIKSKFLAASAIIIAATSCVDKDYDINNLDKSMTILPGVEVPVKNGVVIDESLNSFLTIPELSHSENGAIAVTTDKSATVKKTISEEELSAGQEVSIPGELVTVFDKNNGFFGIPGLGAALNEPAVVVNVKNPSPFPVEFRGDVTDGQKVKSFMVNLPADGEYDVYISEKGEASHVVAGTKAGALQAINVACPGFNEFFAGDIPASITVKDMSCKGQSPALSVTPGANYDVAVNAKAVVNASIAANSSFLYETTIPVNGKDIDLETYNFKAGDKVILNGDITFTDVPLEFTPVIKSNIANVTISPAVIKASEGKVSISVELELKEVIGNINEVSVSLLVANPTNSVFAVTGNEKIAYTIKGITLANGVNL